MTTIRIEVHPHSLTGALVFDCGGLQSDLVTCLKRHPSILPQVELTGKKIIGNKDYLRNPTMNVKAVFKQEY